MSIDIRGICPLLQVFDMPTSIKFYRDVLGFEVAQTSPPGQPETRYAKSGVEPQVALSRGRLPAGGEHREGAPRYPALLDTPKRSQRRRPGVTRPSAQRRVSNGGCGS